MTYNAKILTIPMPARIKRLPISSSGFPVPWFVYFDTNGIPDFRVVGKNKLRDAVTKKLCWICGDVLGSTFAMTIGPMCAINRIISEPPAHRECALYSVKACPFLSNSRMRRNDKVALPEDKVGPAGYGIERNPGAVAVWCTRGYKVFKAPGGILFSFDEPTEVLWYAEGRLATKVEVENSINSGLSSLVEIANMEGPKAMAELTRRIKEVQMFLPK